MEITRTKLVKAIIYLRLSDFRFQETEGSDQVEQSPETTFDARERKLRKLAEHLGWEVYKVVIENDVNPTTGKMRGASAFKRRKVTLADGTTAMRVVRPGYREILNHFSAGRANALLSEDLDRTMRDPRDLEDFIDVAAAKMLNARSLSGSLTFTDGGTDAEITMARLMVTIANKSSRDTSRRVTAGRERAALAGQYSGGRRPFGYESDGMTVRPAEADVVREFSERVLKINLKTKKKWTLKALAAELREANFTTVYGAPLRAEALRYILLRPRNAGIMVYRGEEIGKAAWPAIVPEPTYRAVVRLLTDPSRITGPGPAPRWFGSGIYLCGRCEDGRTTCRVTMGGTSPRYRCSAHNHLTRNTAQLDMFVTDNLMAKFSQPGFIERFVQIPSQAKLDLAALRSEAASIRIELNGLAEDRAMRLIDREQMLTGTTRGQARLGEISQLLSESVVDSPLLDLIGVDDVRAAWDQQPLSIRRTILDTVAIVTINGVGRVGRGPTRFVPQAIDLSFKVPDSTEAA